MKEFLYNYGGNEKYYLKDEISYVYKEDGSVIKEIKQNPGKIQLLMSEKRVRKKRKR